MAYRSPDRKSRAKNLAKEPGTLPNLGQPSNTVNPRDNASELDTAAARRR